MRRLTPIVLLCVALVLAGCNAGSVNEAPLTFADIPTVGDAARGEELFRQSVNRGPTCISCHVVDGTGGASPGLAGYGQIAGERVAGESAREYSFWSIVDVGRHVVEGYANVMYPDYGQRLTPQDIADLIEYMLGL